MTPRRTSTPHIARTIPSAAPGQRGDHALERQLHDQAAAAGAERRADRQLAAARRGPRQGQVGDVRAGDDEDQSDGGEEDEDDGPDLAEDVLLEGRDVRAGTGVARRIGLGELPGHAFQLASACAHRRSGSEAADDVHRVEVPASRELALGDDRRVHPQVEHAGEDEAARQDADDGVGLAVHGQRFADEAPGRRRSATARRRA